MNYSNICDFVSHTVYLCNDLQLYFNDAISILYKWVIIFLSYYRIRDGLWIFCLVNMKPNTLREAKTGKLLSFSSVTDFTGSSVFLSSYGNFSAFLGIHLPFLVKKKKLNKIMYKAMDHINHLLEHRNIIKEMIIIEIDKYRENW